MSRIGKKAVAIPKGVKVTKQARTVQVQGPKGTAELTLRPEVDIDVDAAALHVKGVSTNRATSAYHGMTRALLANMVKGVTIGFVKELEITGVGFKAEVKGRAVVLTIGRTHAIEHAIPAGVEVAVEKGTRITISGFDRQQVGQLASELRAYRRCDPYKLKGIKYVGELIKKKVGKTGVK